MDFPLLDATKNNSESPDCMDTFQISLFVFNGTKAPIYNIILLHEKFLKFDWLRAVVFQLNLKYLHVKITNLLQVVV